MKRGIAILLCLMLFCADSVLAQDVEVLPADPRVKTGKLANGLTYYLYKNVGTPKKADFILAQKIGENVESEDQVGMLKMLEILALRGTRNFPDSTILTYLSNLGLPNKDIQFETNPDNVIYRIKNVPIDNSNVTDSTLLIMYNWMNSINIDEEDIKEASVLYGNRMRNYWSADKRMRFKGEQDYLQKEYRSANSIPWSNFKEFSSKELRNFYYKWFRPDLQAIIISGDIDIESMQTRITSLFSTIPKPLENISDVKKVEVDSLDFVSIQKDKECSRAYVSIDFIKPKLLQKYRNTSVPYIQEFMTESILNLLRARIHDGILKYNIPVWNVDCKVKDMDYVKNDELVSVSFETLVDNIYPTLNFLSSEIDRMAKFGFNGQELIKSKDIYYRNLENLYDTRFSLSNDYFTDMLLNNYLNGYSLGSIELKFEIMKEIVFSITSSQLNEYAKALLGNKEKIRIMCNIPDRRSIDNINKERLLATFKEALATTAPERDARQEETKWPEVICRDDEGGIVKEVADPLTGAKEFHLKNGVTVVFKQTLDSKDTISIRAISKGGFSLIPDVTLINERYMNDLVNIGGLAQIRQPDIKRLYTYNNMDVNARILLDRELVEGYAPRKNIDKLFEAVYLNFAQRRKDSDAFELYKKMKIFEAQYNTMSPERVFADSIIYYNNSNKRYVGNVTISDIANLDYDKRFNQINKRFENAADFVFIVTGNVNPATVKDLAVKYFGMLKGDANKRESGFVVPNYLTKGGISKHFFVEMVVPRCYLNITNSLGVDYNVRNFTMAQLCNVYMKETLSSSPIKNITSDIAINSRILNYPENIFVLNINFIADSSKIFDIKSIYNKTLDDIANGKVDDNIFYSVAGKIKDRYKKIAGENFYWQELLTERYLDNTIFYKDLVATLETITPNEFNDFIKRLITDGNNVEVLMEGTKDDVNTRNMFREDAFVRDFFGM